MRRARRRLSAVIATLLLGATVVAFGAPSPAAADHGPPVFVCDPGAVLYEVPPGTTELRAHVVGGSGGSGNSGFTSSTARGGKAGSVGATLAVAPGDELTIWIGCEGTTSVPNTPGVGGSGWGYGGGGGLGFNGGGGGGGASAVLGPDGMLLTAGGGGGGGGDNDDTARGGSGGGPNAAGHHGGEDFPGCAGRGALVTERGLGGDPGLVGGIAGEPGLGPDGGNGADNTIFTAGGGGGGGAYGGGGGGAISNLSCGGGGGGSGFAHAAGQNVRGTTGARWGDGFVRILVHPTFVDVGFGHPFVDEVEWMADEAISTGYDDDTYRPGAVVTRQAMSAFLYRAAGEPPFTPPPTPTFTDVGTGHPFYAEVEWMAAEGISEGYQPGPTYRPGADVTRQAMSAFLFRAG